MHALDTEITVTISGHFSPTSLPLNHHFLLLEAPHRVGVAEYTHPLAAVPDSPHHTTLRLHRIASHQPIDQLTSSLLIGGLFDTALGPITPLLFTLARMIAFR